MDRATAWSTVTEFVQAAGLRRHMLSVEAAMRAYASRLGADADLWGLAGLLHDFDWEIHPDLERHPAAGAPILRQRGCPEDAVRAILSHNTEATGVQRTHSMDFALLACDEITGLVLASALIRPDKDLRRLEVRSLQKRWKSPAFAAGVDRPQVAAATEDFSRACFDGTLDLWTHAGNVLAAMQEIAPELDLDGRLSA